MIRWEKVKDRARRGAPKDEAPCWATVEEQRLRDPKASAAEGQ